MGIYKYIAKAWQKPKSMDLWRERLIAFRREPSTVVLERPTRLDRARNLGYKPIKGMFVVRQSLIRGPHVRPRPGGRRSKTKTSRMILRENFQVIAEKRAAKAFPGCEAMNSYWVAQDGKRIWYEVILADRNSPDVQARMGSIRRGRAHRGLTSAGKIVRGMKHKGKGAEKVRPSRRSQTIRQ